MQDHGHLEVGSTGTTQGWQKPLAEEDNAVNEASGGHSLFAALGPLVALQQSQMVLVGASQSSGCSQEHLGQLRRHSGAQGLSSYEEFRSKSAAVGCVVLES